MKTRLTLLVILSAILLSSLNIAYRIVPMVNATYVEGVISRDTIWTLVDSPFVLSDNVTVSSAATLTIEPGAEIRFGGDFSLVVNGRIVASGTEARNIYFTTNDPSNAIAWQTIEINGAQSSLFVNCIIEHGRDGITLQGGSLTIQNSAISSSTENGITVDGGALTIQDSEVDSSGVNGINIVDGNYVSVESNIIDSNGNGVLIAGGTQVDVHNNLITSNGNGLLLTGQLTGTVDIRQNEISLSKQNGILLEPDTLGNTFIVENNISANGCGLFVSSIASTYVTRNYFSNNTVGLYYTGPANHQVYFNDIYDNGQGVELDPSYAATVNAVRNYWGDETGPKHDSLNPYGKGNSVGGDGENLVFIPFLTHPFAYVNTPPIAVIWTDKLLVARGQAITFVGTDSTDDGSIYQYLFDFNDGVDSGWTTLSLFNHSYSLTGTYNPSLMVEDDFGSRSAPVLATVTVVDLPPLDVLVTLGNSTVPYNGQVPVSVYVSAGGTRVGNASVTMLSAGGGSFSPQSGLTDANGYFTTTFTAPNVTKTTDVRIIARTSFNGYADGSDYKYVRVLPPLRVQVTPVPSIIKSEEKTTLIVHVTDELGEPIIGANLALSCSNGTLTNNEGTTDSNGAATFTLTAPMTLSQVNLTVTVTASKPQYPTGQGEASVSVEPRQLDLDVTANPDVILSEEAATITVKVTFDLAPVVNATVTVASDAGGTFSMTSEQTDQTGISRFAFTAPQTSLSDGINVTITAKAVKSEYLDAEGQTVVAIKPKTLSIDIIPDSYITYSEGKSNIVAHVRYQNTSIQGAVVTITATSGSFTETVGVTDDSGNATFIFTAPQVNVTTGDTFSATASAVGYLDGAGQLNITVNPRTFGFQMTPATLVAGKTETVSVHVTCKEDDTAVAGAAVTISYANKSPLTNVTDSTGTCTFIVNAPQTSASQLNMTVSVAKSGYEQRQANVILNVIQGEQGFPWITVLLIAIPIVVVVIVIVLIKTKRIVLSNKEDTEG